MRLNRPLRRFGRQPGGDMQQQYPLYPPDMLAEFQAHPQAQAYYADQRAGLGRPHKAMHRSRRILNSLMVLGLVLASVWLWQERDGIMSRLHATSADMGLALNTIRVEGRVNISHDHILAAVNMTRGAPLLAADLPAIHARLTSLGWVDTAGIERHFPDTLVIRIVERKALAIYQGSLAHHVIDSQGEIIKGVRAEDFRHLKVVSGVGAASRANAIITLLKTQPALYSEVWSLTRQSERRWDVHLKNGVLIQLPEYEAQAAWQLLADMDTKHQLTQRNLISIDLRVAGRVILRLDRPLPKGDVPAGNEGGQT